METLYKVLDIEVESVDEKAYSIDAIFSTANQDRHGDVVQQNWDLGFYKTNPVILNSHNYSDATEVIGKAPKISVKDGKLQGKIEFAVKENPKAKIIFDLYAGKFLSAFSVGFIPKEWNNKGDITMSELLEVSAVSVPANAYALAKAKGIDITKLYEDNTTKDNGNDEEDIGDNDDSKIEGGASDTASETVDEEKVIPEVVVDGEDEEDDTKDIPPEVMEEIEQELPLIDEGEELEKRKQKVIQTIAKAINLLGELKKVGTHREDVRAENRRIISKAIRDLIKVKKVQ